MNTCCCTTVHLITAPAAAHLAGDPRREAAPVEGRLPRGDGGCTAGTCTAGTSAAGPLATDRREGEGSPPASPPARPAAAGSSPDATAAVQGWAALRAGEATGS